MFKIERNLITKWCRVGFLVIRLLLDGQSQLQQGVVVDLNEQPVDHFQQLESLPGLVANWMSVQGQGRLDRNNLHDV